AWRELAVRKDLRELVGSSDRQPILGGGKPRSRHGIPIRGIEARRVRREVEPGTVEDSAVDLFLVQLDRLFVLVEEASVLGDPKKGILGIVFVVAGHVEPGTEKRHIRMNTHDWKEVDLDRVHAGAVPAIWIPHPAWVTGSHHPVAAG